MVFYIEFSRFNTRLFVPGVFVPSVFVPSVFGLLNTNVQDSINDKIILQ
jgi:hypothetical protein